MNNIQNKSIENIRKTLNKLKVNNNINKIINKNPDLIETVKNNYQIHNNQQKN